MSDVRLEYKSVDTDVVINLPTSKSISNRVLIINALSGASAPVINPAKCDDTDAMITALESQGSDFNIGHAGTAMRFLTAYLAQRSGEWRITGSSRMEERPIGVLVDALRELGAEIEYEKLEGFPPLRIKGGRMKGGAISVPASVSSQYISALMMIAPNMQNGLKLILEGHIASRPYIEMTASIMRTFGAEVEWQGNNVVAIEPTGYTPVAYSVESDWSAASYIFQIASLLPGVRIYLPNLLRESLQGDAGQIELWKMLGVRTCFVDGGIEIMGEESKLELLEFNFNLMPDLVQSFAVACCLKGVKFRFTGVETLRIKETDRISALQNELLKLGYVVKVEGDSLLYWDGECVPAAEEVTIATYRDHRMAMAFAPAAIVRRGVIVADCEVVSKSFPTYWQVVEQLGIFTVCE